VVVTNLARPLSDAMWRTLKNFLIYRRRAVNLIGTGNSGSGNGEVAMEMRPLE